MVQKRATDISKTKAKNMINHSRTKTSVILLNALQINSKNTELKQGDNSENSDGQM